MVRSIIALAVFSVLAQAETLIYESEPVKAVWAIETNVIKAFGFDFCLEVKDVKLEVDDPLATSKISLSKSRAQATDVAVKFLFVPGEAGGAKVCGFVAPCDIFKLVTAEVTEPGMEFILSIYSSDFTAGENPMEINSVFQMARFNREGDVATILYNIAGNAFNSCTSFNFNENGVPVDCKPKPYCAGDVVATPVSWKLYGNEISMDEVQKCFISDSWEMCDGTETAPKKFAGFVSVIEKKLTGDLNLIMDIPTDTSHDAGSWKFCATVDPCDVLEALNPNVKYPETLELSVNIAGPGVLEWRSGGPMSGVAARNVTVEQNEDGTYAKIIKRNSDKILKGVTGFQLGPHKNPIKCLAGPIPGPQGDTTEAAGTSAEGSEGSGSTSSSSTLATIFSVTTAIITAVFV